MRHAGLKFARTSESRQDALGFALVIAAMVSAVTTALYALSIAAQGGLPLLP